MADHVPRGSNCAVTTVGYGRSGTIQKFDPVLYPRLERGSCGL